MYGCIGQATMPAVDPTALGLGSVLGIVGIALAVTQLIKVKAKDVPYLGKVPTLVYPIVLVFALTAIANLVLKTLPGDFKTVMVEALKNLFYTLGGWAVVAKWGSSPADRVEGTVLPLSGKSVALVFCVGFAGLLLGGLAGCSGINDIKGGTTQLKINHNVDTGDDEATLTHNGDVASFQGVTLHLDKDRYARISKTSTDDTVLSNAQGQGYIAQENAIRDMTQMFCSTILSVMGKAPLPTTGTPSVYVPTLSVGQGGQVNTPTGGTDLGSLLMRQDLTDEETLVLIKVAKRTANVAAPAARVEEKVIQHRAPKAPKTPVPLESWAPTSQRVTSQPTK